MTHLPERQTAIYAIAGSWEINLLGDVIRPQTTKKKVRLEGHAAVTRVSPCRLKINLRNVSFSDWQEVSKHATQICQCCISCHLLSFCLKSIKLIHRLANNVYSII